MLGLDAEANFRAQSAWKGKLGPSDNYRIWRWRVDFMGMPLEHFRYAKGTNCAL